LAEEDFGRSFKFQFGRIRPKETTPQFSTMPTESEGGFYTKPSKAPRNLSTIIDDGVETLGLSCLVQKISTAGETAYHPDMMVKVHFYTCPKFIFRSGNAARAIKENLSFILLAAWLFRNFREPADCRVNSLEGRTCCYHAT